MTPSTSNSTIKHFPQSQISHPNSISSLFASPLFFHMSFGTLYKLLTFEATNFEDRIRLKDSRERLSLTNVLICVQNISIPKKFWKFHESLQIKFSSENSSISRFRAAIFISSPLHAKSLSLVSVLINYNHVDRMRKRSYIIY